MAVLSNLTAAAGMLAAVLTGCLDSVKDTALPPANTPPESGEAIVKDKDGVTPEEDTIASPGYDFGSFYRIHQNDTTPRLQGDSLYVQLGYDCRPDSVIALEYSKAGVSSYEIWLKRRGPVFACTMPITDKRAFLLPAEIVAADTVRLIKPEGGAITLKN